MYTMYFDYVHPQDLPPAIPRTPQSIFLQFHIIVLSSSGPVASATYWGPLLQRQATLPPSAAINSSPASPSPTHTGPRTGSMWCRTHTGHHGCELVCAAAMPCPGVSVPQLSCPSSISKSFSPRPCCSLSLGWEKSISMISTHLRLSTQLPVSWVRPPAPPKGSCSANSQGAGHGR